MGVDGGPELALEPAGVSLGGLYAFVVERNLAARNGDLAVEFPVTPVAKGLDLVVHRSAIRVLLGVFGTRRDADNWPSTTPAISRRASTATRTRSDKEVMPDPPLPLSRP